VSNPSGLSRNRKPLAILGKMIVVIEDQAAGFRHLGRDRRLYARQDGNRMAEWTGYFNAVTTSDGSHAFLGWALSFFMP
jgi:hypothetical protein